jgi:hypothetical protein
MLGVVEALNRTPVDPSDALWGAGYGTIQGAAESGQDLGDVTSEVVREPQLRTRSPTLLQDSCQYSHP